MRFDLQPQTVGASPSLPGPPRLHVVAIPLDDDAEGLRLWPTDPRPLCGRRLKPHHVKGHPEPCDQCADRAALLMTTVAVLERCRNRKKESR